MPQSSREIIKRLLKEGWVEVAVRGSHHNFKHPAMSHKITVPHPIKELTIGTYNSIRKAAGWK